MMMKKAAAKPVPIPIALFTGTNGSWFINWRAPQNASHTARTLGLG
jgi:hypothetical protein